MTLASFACASRLFVVRIVVRQTHGQTMVNLEGHSYAIFTAIVQGLEKYNRCLEHLALNSAMKGACYLTFNFNHSIGINEIIYTTAFLKALKVTKIRH